MKRRAFIKRASILGIPLFGSRLSNASEAGQAEGAVSGSEGSASHLTSSVSDLPNSGPTPQYRRTAEEILAGITPVNYGQPAGNVRRYGAVGDGVNNDSAAVQSAVAASQNVFFPTGDYLLRKKIDLRSGTSLVGDGTATLKTDSTSYILSATGKIGARHPLRRNATRADSQVAVAATTGAAYVKAGGLFLQSDRPPLGHLTHRSGELGMVASVTNDEVTVMSTVLADYLIGDNAMAAPVTFVENISIRGLRLSNNNYKSDPARVTSALIYLEFVRDFHISECSLQENNSAGISAFNCLNGSINGNIIGRLRNGRGGILGYGVQLGYSSQNITVSANAFFRCRHAVTTGTGTKSGRTPNYGVSRGLTIVGNTVSHCTHAGLDTHEDSDGVTISGNTVTGCRPVGIHVRSYRTAITGNSITSCSGKGIRIAKSAKDTVVSGNIVRGIRLASTDGYGIVVDSNAVTISGNRISDCDRHGILVGRNASRDISITGNTCKNNGRAGAGDGININRGGPISRLTVVGNTCTDDQTHKTQRFNFSIERGTRISATDSLVASNNFSVSAHGGINNQGVGAPTFDGNLGQETVAVLPARSSAPSVAHGTLFRTSGSARVGFFADGQVGRVIQVLATGNTIIGNNAKLRLSGGRDYLMQDGDTLTLTMFDDQIWQETGRSVSQA